MENDPPQDRSLNPHQTIDEIVSELRQDVNRNEECLGAVQTFVEKMIARLIAKLPAADRAEIEAGLSDDPPGGAEEADCARGVLNELERLDLIRHGS